MAGIPKKVSERFIKSIGKFQKVLKIARDRDVNEADTVAIIGDILAEVFGFEKYLEITGEFAIRNTYCDLAIKIDEKVQYIIEVKAIGLELKDIHLRQAIEYGATHGLPWIILTNGIDWQVYRIKFEKPINYDLVCSFNFLDINPRSEKDQDPLFIISKEGIIKDSRIEFYDKVKSVNRFMIGGLILNDTVLNTIRRELRKIADGVKIETQEIESLIRSEVLKRDVIDGEEAKEAQARINRYYKKVARKSKAKESDKDKAGTSSETTLFYPQQYLNKAIKEERGTH